MRGRTPKYRLGLYGPHNRELFEATCSDDAEVERLDKQRVTKAEMVTIVARQDKACGIFGVMASKNRNKDCFPALLGNQEAR
jgi:hypothetical protein